MSRASAPSTTKIIIIMGIANPIHMYYTHLVPDGLDRANLHTAIGICIQITALHSNLSNQHILNLVLREREGGREGEKREREREGEREAKRERRGGGYENIQTCSIARGEDTPLVALMQKLSCACANISCIRAVVASAERSGVGAVCR